MAGQSFHRFVMLRRAARVLCTVCLCVLLSVFPGQSVWARTISLAYDDSGSMGESFQRDWNLHANYATQALAALLRADDELRIVYMSASDQVKKYPLNGQAARKKALDEISKNFNADANTEYQAVETAAAQLIQSGTGTQAAFGTQESNWLVVFTDGALDVGEAGIHAKKFFANQHAKETRVIFLLIGDAKDKDGAALAWRDAAPAKNEQVDILKAPNGKALPDRMQEVAQLINGRDKTGTQLTRQGQTISFDSPFPLRRISVFEQSADGSADFARLTDKGVQTPDGSVPATEYYSVKAPSTGKTSGQVSHTLGSNGQVMPAGTYVLQFDRAVEGRKNLQVLLEPQVDFEVKVFSNGQEPTKKPNTGEYELCPGDEVELRVHFSVPGQSGTLSITPEIADGPNGLKVKGKLSGADSRGVEFEKHSSGDYYYSEPLKLKPGKTTLSVDAKHAGYFQKKAIYVLNGEKGNCKLSAEARFDPPAIHVTYQPEDGFNDVGGSELHRGGDSYTANHTISISKLPAGVEVFIGGQAITANKPLAIPFEHGRPLDVKVRTNKEFKAAATLHFQIETDNSKVRSIPPAQLHITLGARALRIDEQPEGPGGKLKTQPDELGKMQTGPSFALLVDNNAVQGQERGNYELTARFPAPFVKADVKEHPTQPGQYHVVFQQGILSRLLLFLIEPGRTSITVRAKGPGPGEEASGDVSIIVEDIGWRKYLPLAVLTLCTIFALWWINACRKKPRFGKRSHIDFKYIRNPGTTMEKTRRECTHYLAGWRARYDGNRLANFLLRWCWPFGPEKRRVEGVTFLAHRSKAQIVLPGKFLSEYMEINGLAPTENDIRDRKNQFVHISLDINDRNGKTRNRYLYSAS